jgi:hypothetical protein
MGILGYHWVFSMAVSETSSRTSTLPLIRPSQKTGIEPFDPEPVLKIFGKEEEGA